MKTCGALCALLGLVRLALVRSSCPDVDEYFGSMTIDTSEVNLGQTTRLACPKDEDTEIVIVSGQHLTVKSGIDYQEPVKFKNIRFTVEDGATLVFEKFVFFGPNNQDFYTHAFYVSEGATVTFMGKFRASKVPSVFWNQGYTEFKAKTFFNNNSNVFAINTGTLKFRRKTTFKNNDYHGIENHSTGFVRFSRNVFFIGNGATFDDTSGCGLENMGGTVIFRGDATFSEHKCKEAAAVFNYGKMRFYGKTIFNDNHSEHLGYGQSGGGGLRSWQGGDLIFKGDVEFNRNSGYDGGGMAVFGGDVTFWEAVSFTDNEGEMNGGGFAVYGGGFAVFEEGSVKFAQPDLVTAVGNIAASECSFGYVGEDGTVVGLDDVCDNDE